MAILILPLKLIPLAPWRLILLVNILPSIFCSIGLFFIPESPKYLLDKGEQEQCIQVLQTVYSMNTGNPKDLYPCECIHSNNQKEDQIDGIIEKLKLMVKQTMIIFNREHICKTLKFHFVSLSLTLVGAGLYMWLPPVLNYMLTYKEEKLTVCDVVKLVQKKNANLTYEEKCMVEKDVTQFKILFFINIAYLVFYALTSVLTTILGRRLKTSFARHILKLSILGGFSK